MMPNLLKRLEQMGQERSVAPKQLQMQLETPLVPVSVSQVDFAQLRVQINRFWIKARCKEPPAFERDISTTRFVRILLRRFQRSLIMATVALHYRR
jgi:hypothetical protein